MKVLSAIDGRSGISPPLFRTLVVVTAIVPLILLVAPAAASQLASQLKLSPSQVGTYFFFELGAFSLGTLPSDFWFHRIDARPVARVSSVVFCVGNVGTVCCLSAFGELLAVRAITALAAGTLNVLCLMTAAKAINPDRVFGVCIVGQLSVGAIGLWIFPKLFVTFGIGAMYACMGVLAAGTIFVSRNFPTFLEKPRAMAAESPEAGARRWSGIYLPTLVVTAVFLFFVLPFIFAASARVSSSKLFGSLSLFVGAGLAIGPLIGGFLIQLTGSAMAWYWAAAGVAAVSAVMLNHIAAIASNIDRTTQAASQR